MAEGSPDRKDKGSNCIMDTLQAKLTNELTDLINTELESKVSYLVLSEEFPQDFLESVGDKRALSVVLGYAVLQYLHRSGIVDLPELD